MTIEARPDIRNSVNLEFSVDEFIPLIKTPSITQPNLLHNKTDTRTGIHSILQGNIGRTRG